MLIYKPLKNRWKIIGSESHIQQRSTVTVESASGLYIFHLVALLANIYKWKMWSGMQGKVYAKKSSWSGWRGVTSHKHARVCNNFKSEDLILKRKLHHLNYIAGNYSESSSFTILLPTAVFYSKFPIRSISSLIQLHLMSASSKFHCIMIEVSLRREGS